MLELAKAHLAFWKRHRVLTAQPIARMKDVELTCELVGAMLRGLQNQKKIIGTLYKTFDDKSLLKEYKSAKSNKTASTITGAVSIPFAVGGVRPHPSPGSNAALCCRAPPKA